LRDICEDARRAVADVGNEGGVDALAVAFCGYSFAHQFVTAVAMADLQAPNIAFLTDWICEYYQGGNKPSAVLLLSRRARCLLAIRHSLERKRRKEKFTLFSDHNRSLLRRQPGADTA